MNALLPCPFCNAPAEADTCRSFMNYKRQPANAVAVYCTECDADMSLCYEDFPSDTPGQLLATLAGQWNKRNGETLEQRKAINSLGQTLLKAERDELRQALVRIVALLELVTSKSPTPLPGTALLINQARAVLSNGGKP